MPTVRSRPDRPRVALALALVGGFLDGYTYLGRGGVFANAQTGNVVLAAVELSHGAFAAMARHLPSLAAFVLGLVVAERLADRRGRLWRRPTRIVLGVEAVTLCVVALIPRGDGADLAATSLVSLAAALQVATFKQVGAQSYNTTMTTGNLRSLVSAVYDRWVRGDRGGGLAARTLASVVLCFAGGAALGGLLTRHCGAWTVALAVPVLLVVLADVVRETSRLEHESPGPGATRAVVPEDGHRASTT